jgi:DNA topoisomerase-1
VSYPAVEIGKDPESGEPLVVKVGRYGPYLRRGGGNGARGEGAARSEGVVSLPEDLPPADLTIERALEMLRAKGEEPEPVAADPATGRPVYLRHGRFGFYLEREPSAEEKAAEAKPHRVSLPRGLEPGDVDAATARALISLPRTIGRHPGDGEPVTAAIGRFGPYVKHGSDFRSVKDWRQAVEIGLDEALALLAQPKPGRGGARRGAAKTVLKELGAVPGAAGPVQVLDGRYGPYVSDGETNATLPKGSDPQAVTAEEAAALLDARRGQPKTKGRGRRRK